MIPRMGTLLLLYHHPEASRIVEQLNARNRCWTTGDQKAYAELARVLNIEEATRMPHGTTDVAFQSKRHPDCFPTRVKMDRLGAYLTAEGTVPLNEIFGFASWDPEEAYRIPDWTRCRERLGEAIRWADTRPGGVEPSARRHLEALEELVAWVLDQPDRSAYFLVWSY